MTLAASVVNLNHVNSNQVIMVYSETLVAYKSMCFLLKTVTHGQSSVAADFSHQHHSMLVDSNVSILAIFSSLSFKLPHSFLAGPENTICCVVFKIACCSCIVWSNSSKRAWLYRPFTWDNQHIVNSFKYAPAPNQTQDSSNTSFWSNRCYQLHHRYPLTCL